MKIFSLRNLVIVSVVVVAIAGVMFSGDRLDDLKSQLVPAKVNFVDVPNYSNFTCDQLFKLRDSLEIALKKILAAELTIFDPNNPELFSDLRLEIRIFPGNLTVFNATPGQAEIRHRLSRGYQQLLDILENVNKMLDGKCQEVYDHSPIHPKSPETTDATFPPPKIDVVQGIIDRLSVDVSTQISNYVSSLYQLQILLELGLLSTDPLTALQIQYCFDLLFRGLDYEYDYSYDYDREVNPEPVVVAPVVVTPEASKEKPDVGFVELFCLPEILDKSPPLTLDDPVDEPLFEEEEPEELGDGECIL